MSTLPFGQITKLDSYPEPFASQISKTALELSSRAAAFSKDPENPEARVDLNRLIWPLITSLFQGKVARTTSTRLHFDEREKLLINFGLVDRRVFSGTDDDIETLIEDSKSTPSIPEAKFDYLIDWVERRYRRLLSVPKLRKLGGELAGARRALRESTVHFETCRASRIAAAETCAKARKYLDVADQIDNILPLYTILATRRRRQSLPPAESRGFRNMQRSLSSLEEKREHFLRSGDSSAKLRNVDRETTLALLKIPKYEMEIERLERDTRAVMRRRRQITPQTKLELVRSEVDVCRRLLRSASGISIEKYPHTFLGAPPDFTRMGAAGILLAVLKCDKVLHHGISAGASESIRFVLLPGRGTAFYDEPFDCIFVPVMVYAMDADESIVRAIAHYRLKNTPKLSEAYRSLAQISVYRSRLVIRKRFTSDYWHWIDREARGFKKLPIPVREWFAEHVFRELGPEERSE